MYMRGCDVEMYLIAPIPVLFAIGTIRLAVSPLARALAWAFLTLIALGPYIADIFELFPNLGHERPQLGQWEARLLDWYIGIISIWLLIVMPMYFFGGGLGDRERRGGPVFSPFTCFVGLLVPLLSVVGIPFMLAGMGFWPGF
jgi:hypothetical protein